MDQSLRGREDWPLVRSCSGPCALRACIGVKDERGRAWLTFEQRSEIERLEGRARVLHPEIVREHFESDEHAAVDACAPIVRFRLEQLRRAEAPCYVADTASACIGIGEDGLHGVRTFACERGRDSEFGKSGAALLYRCLIPVLAHAPRLAGAELDFADVEHRIFGRGRSRRTQDDPISDQKQARSRCLRRIVCHALPPQVASRKGRRTAKITHVSGDRRARMQPFYSGFSADCHYCCSLFLCPVSTRSLIGGFVALLAGLLSRIS